LDPCVYDIFDSESALELNPEVVTLTPGTLCILLNLEGSDLVEQIIQINTEVYI